MNIGIDAASILYYRNRGIGNYALQLLKAMLGQNVEHEYFLLNWSKESLQDRELCEFPNFHECCIGHTNLSQAQGFMGYRFFPERTESAIKDFLSKYHIDAFLNVAPFAPIIPPYRKQWFQGVGMVAIVHDAIPYVLRKETFGTETAFQDYMKYAKALKQYDVLCADSESTKEDIIRYFRVKRTSIYPVYGDCAQLTEKEYPFEEMKARFGLSDKFWLAVLGDGINKNVSALIEAYGRLDEAEQKQLVIACKVQPQVRMQWDALIDGYNLHGKVKITGFVQDEELAMLYRKAEWAVFPSLYEGLGLPVLEAWRHRLPVLTSSNSSLGEIAAGAAVLVNPFSIESITQGLKRIGGMEEKERQKYVKLGWERSKQFSWKKTARLVQEKLDEAYQSQGKQDLKKYFWTSGWYDFWCFWRNHLIYYRREG